MLYLQNVALPLVKIAQCGLVFCTRADTSPRIAKQREVALVLDEVCHYADLGFGPGLRRDECSVVALQELVVKGESLPDVHEFRMDKFR